VRGRARLQALRDTHKSPYHPDALSGELTETVHIPEAFAAARNITLYFSGSMDRPGHAARRQVCAGQVNLPEFQTHPNSLRDIPPITLTRFLLFAVLAGKTVAIQHARLCHPGDGSELLRKSGAVGVLPGAHGRRLGPTHHAGGHVRVHPRDHSGRRQSAI
jgi:hypothetical protein